MREGDSAAAAGANRRLHVTFERTTSRGPTYPGCQQVLGAVRQAYGAPSNVQEFDEERGRNRRYIWVNGDEELSLLCFKLGTPEFSASELTIAPRPSGR